MYLHVYICNCKKVCACISYVHVIYIFHTMSYFIVVIYISILNGAGFPQQNFVVETEKNGIM